jgi:hypothetical protein
LLFVVHAHPQYLPNLKGIGRYLGLLKNGTNVTELSNVCIFDEIFVYKNMNMSYHLKPLIGLAQTCICICIDVIEECASV